MCYYVNCEVKNQNGRSGTEKMKRELDTRAAKDDFIMGRYTRMFVTASACMLSIYIAMVALLLACGVA